MLMLVQAVNVQLTLVLLRGSRPANCWGGQRDLSLEASLRGLMCEGFMGRG